jgi:hypothetical protein
MRFAVANANFFKKYARPALWGLRELVVRWNPMTDFSSELLCPMELDAEMAKVCGESMHLEGEPQEVQIRLQARSERSNCLW